MSLVPHKLEHKVPPSQPLLETQIGKIDDISGFDVDFLSLSLCCSLDNFLFSVCTGSEGERYPVVSILSQFNDQLPVSVVTSVDCGLSSNE